MDEASNKQHRIRMQIADTDFVIIAEPLQEWMYRNTKSMSEVFFKTTISPPLGSENGSRSGACHPASSWA
jgi:hypothetical protein